MFDLIVFPLSLEAGQEQYELPGLLVASAPRKAARMRAQDHLVLYIKLRTIAGSTASGLPGVAAGPALTNAQQKEILTRLADTYFTFSGSITAGLRVVAARLNDFLLNRNLKSAHEGQTVGTLNMAVIHGDRLVVGHAGATHSFMLAKNEVQHFDDGQAGRGLGLSRQIMPRFYQTSLNAGDLLVVCTEPPTGWDARSLANSPQLSFDHLRRRLTSGTGADMQAGVVRFQAGKGQVTYWRPGETVRAPGKTPGGGRPQPRHSEAPAESEPIEAQAFGAPPVEERSQTNMGGASVVGEAWETASMDLAPGQVSEGEIAGDSGASDASMVETEESAYEDVKENALSPGNAPDLEEAELSDVSADLAMENGMPIQESPVLSSGERPGQISQLGPMEAQAAVQGTAAMPSERRVSEQARPTVRPQREKQPAVKRPARREPGAFQKGLAAAAINTRLSIKKIGLAFARVGQGISHGLEQILPRQYDADGRVIPFFNLSAAQMLVIAILIPLVVVTVGTTVYVRSGLTEQFQQRLQNAQFYAQQASQLQDPAQQREGYRQAYALLQDASKLGENEESIALKQQIIQALDTLDGIVRLSYQPAVSGGLQSDVMISKIVATTNDVFLLDSSQGRIIHLIRTSTGYELDVKFACGPGQAGSVIINPLIDLAPLPTNEMKSRVMGIDMGGNLVYCASTQTGFDARPLTVPDAGWGNISGVTIDGNTLYVMDPKTNAVYRYDGKDGIFENPPHLYFDNVIPQMSDVIDLAVNQEFLYLLHVDGRMTVCESGGFAFAATKCTDPAPYGDSRPGYEAAPLTFAGARFTQIQTTEPPDPSLFALDAANKSIYHLSLRRLNLQRQYRSVVDGNFPLPDEAATAFAVAHRRVLIAFGNKLFFAAVP